jgi:transposase-like protein
MDLFQKNNAIYCKYCGNYEVIKFGSYRGNQRYFCKLCRRKIRNDNNVFHMNVQSNCIDYVLNSYYNGMEFNNMLNNVELNYGIRPSRAVAHLWINKYTSIAREMLLNHQPKVSNMWVINEMILMLYRNRLWIYETIDIKTNYVLDLTFSVQKIPSLATIIKVTSEKTQITPRIVAVYMPSSRFREMTKGIGYFVEHVPKEIYADAHRLGISGNVNIYDTSTYRIINSNSLRTIKTASEFINGLRVHHNYFQKNDNLYNQTPAEAAKINYPCHSWKDLIEINASSRCSLENPQK